MKAAGWRPPPWFDLPGRRAAFLHQLRALPELTTTRHRVHRGGFVVSFSLMPKGIAVRRVTVQFHPRSPSSPLVYVDGPADSPHRYEDGTLCMWQPTDSAPMRWSPRDGSAELATRIAVHLVKEEWFRRSGEWIGEEVLHHPPDNANDPERT